MWTGLQTRSLFAEHMHRNLYSVTYRDMSQVSTRGVCEKQPFNLHCHNTDGQKRVVSAQRQRLFSGILLFAEHMHRNLYSVTYRDVSEVLPTLRKTTIQLALPPHGWTKTRRLRAATASVFRHSCQLRTLKRWRPTVILLKLHVACRYRYTWR